MGGGGGKERIVGWMWIRNSMIKLIKMGRKQFLMFSSNRTRE